MRFSEADIARIAQILNASPISTGDEIRFELRNATNGFSLTLTIHQNVPWKNQTITVISALTPSGMYQLHNCTGYVTFEDEEVIFIARDLQHPSPYFSTMTIGNNASCSVFAMVHQELLHTDFGSLDERLLLAAMQLAIVESLLSKNA